MQEIDEKKIFSDRLKQQLTQRGWPNSPTWLAREFNLRYSGKSVTVQTANNWLLGRAIPNQDKLQVLAAWLDISSQWLRFGETENQAEIQQQNYPNIQLALPDLSQKFSKLSPPQKQLIHELIDALLLTNQS